jgi:hypothetical protein
MQSDAAIGLGAAPIFSACRSRGIVAGWAGGHRAFARGARELAIGVEAQRKLGGCIAERSLRDGHYVGAFNDLHSEL